MDDFQTKKELCLDFFFGLIQIPSIQWNGPWSLESSVLCLPWQVSGTTPQHRTLWAMQVVADRWVFLHWMWDCVPKGSDCFSHLKLSPPRSDVKIQNWIWNQTKPNKQAKTFYGLKCIIDLLSFREDVSRKKKKKHSQMMGHVSE